MLVIIDVLFSSSLGDFQSAVPYCERSCETVGVVYGRNSVEVGNEKEKLSQLLFHRWSSKGLSSNYKQLIP